MPVFRHSWLGLVLSYLLLLPVLVAADPLAAPGDMRLRHDLQLLNDAGVINVPLTAWPIPLGDIHAALDDSRTAKLSMSEQAAYDRVREYLAWELDVGEIRIRTGLSAAAEPRVIRGFENTPREEGEASLGFAWLGERFTVNLAASYAANPLDGDEFRPDGTYVGVVFGNWIVTAGWQERWWGPSRDGSLILGSNARPTPGIAVQRNISAPFATKWLSWMGPWTLTSFMSQLDDDRVVRNALLFGVRGSIRPPKTGLEIGISRTAQWCGDDRPCGAGTFVDLLLGKDNRGVNVDPEKEPGNQLGGIDIRWRLPAKIPAAVYMQWIGEDGRGGGGAIGNWIRQLGAETWTTFGRYSVRAHVEASDTLARQGGFGFSDPRINYAYNHAIYRTGYRYEGRVLGHGMDNDGRMVSAGATLVDDKGRSWNVTLRSSDINRTGPPDTRHTLSPTPAKQIDALLSHERMTRFGRFHAGIGYERVTDEIADTSIAEVSGFIRWSSN